MTAKALNWTLSCSEDKAFLQPKVSNRIKVMVFYQIKNKETNKARMITSEEANAQSAGSSFTIKTYKAFCAPNPITHCTIYDLTCDHFL